MTHTVDLTPLSEKANDLVARMTKVAEQTFPYHGDDQHSVESEDLNAVETVATLLAAIAKRCPRVPAALYEAVEEHLGHLESCVADHEEYQTTLDEGIGGP